MGNLHITLPYTRPTTTQQKTPKISNVDAIQLTRHRKILKERLKQAGLEEIYIKPDGNCFFAALSDCLKRKHQIDISAADIRYKCVCEWLKNKKYYSSFLGNEINDDVIESFKKDGFYDCELGDLLPLTACNALSIRMTVISSILEYESAIEFDPIQNEKLPKVCLAFTQFNKGHYNSTQPLAEVRNLITSSSKALLCTTE